MGDATAWVLASRNRKKVEELRAILAGFGVAVASLDDFPGVPDVEETGLTFAENAVLKAEAVRAFTGRTALADDSGLCVDALGGAPGVRSARYADAPAAAGREAVDRANNEKLLAALAGVPSARCGAAFRCAVALAPAGGATRVFEGETRGRILEIPSAGAGGFGYDPLFWSDELRQSFADAPAGEKNRVSHRARALAALCRHLEDRHV